MKYTGQHIYDYVATFRQDVTMDGALTVTDPSTFGHIVVGNSLTFDSVVLGALQTSAESFADNDTSIMTSAAIDDRINTAVTAEDLDVTSDSGTIDIDLNSETLTIAGGSALSTAATGTTVTVNHDDTSSQASVDNSGSTYIQDVTLDTYGHVTGLTSAAIPTLNQNTTGSAATLTTARNIAGVAFDGSASISLNNNAITNGAGYTTNTGDITGVTLTADDEEVATDTAGSADFTIAGGAGIDTTSDGESTITITGETSTATNAGIVELATPAECTTGTDTARAVTPEGLATAKVIGQYAVLRCQSFYVNDVPMVQNNLYFGNSVGHQPNNWNDPAPVGGVIGDTSSFAIAGDDENWGMVLPFNISKIEVQCSLRPQLGTGDDLTVAIYTGTRSSDSSADLTLTKVAHNSVNISSTINRYTQNDVDYTGDLNKGTMIYVGVGTEDSTDMKNGRGYMNITVVRR